MKFKVLKGTKLFDQLWELGEQIRNANNIAFDLCKEAGFEAYRGGWSVLGGGISAFQCEGTKPEGWKYAYGDRDRQAIFPMKNRKEHKELLQKIKELPVVEHNALNEILKFNPHDRNEKSHNNDGSFKIQFFPHVEWKEEYILVETQEYMNYKSLKDMVEITVSEYEKLSKAKNKKVKK